jgi:UTP--glucose-1-phosphate uridylyltransferase
MQRSTCASWLMACNGSSGLTPLIRDRLMPHKPVRKAVFPVAGLGTRFLPATKTVPKELLTVVDRPVIQHVIDEAREAGIEQFVFVTGRGKSAIEDYFDHAPELEETLAKRPGREADLKELLGTIPTAGTASFTRQQAPLGLGHAVWCARELIGDEPFALLLPDMVTQADAKLSPGRRCLGQMMDVYARVGGNIIGVEAVPDEETSKYGIVALGAGTDPVWPITAMVEKPKAGTAPSNLYIMGRYILQPEVFGFLSRMEKGAGGEIQITDAMVHLLKEQGFTAVRNVGRTFDCGSKLGFLAGNVALGLARADIGPELREVLKGLI